MHIYKECMRPYCEKKYDKSQRGFYREECDCGAPLRLIEKKIEILNEDVFVPTQEVETVNTPIVNEEELARHLFSVDPKGYIHFIELQEEESVNTDKLVIYLDGKIYKEVPLEYDETYIGRKSLWGNPDVDLSEIDPNNYVSRKHLMIYRENGKYFARNLSTKNSVHIERAALKQDESKELKDENLIILSRYVVMIFKKRVERN